MFNWSSFVDQDVYREAARLIQDETRWWQYEDAANERGTSVQANGQVIRGRIPLCVEQALLFRKPTAMMIDEAQHLGKVASGRPLLDQLDVIKSIANRTNTVHVLFGTYDLLAFRNLSGQLSRRSVDVHFPRYRADVTEDRRIFINIVHSFQKKLPLPEPPDLVKHWEFLYERSLGCVGVLKQWLAKALATGLRQGDGALSIRSLEAHALSIKQCDKILSEIMEGEAHLNDGDGLRSKLRMRLGLADSIDTDPSDSATQGCASPRRNVRPGQRKPARDPVGRPAHAGSL